MEQLKWYLSLQQNIGNVLVIGNGQDIRELAFYLEHVLRVDSVSLIGCCDAETLREFLVKSR